MISEMHGIYTVDIKKVQCTPSLINLMIAAHNWTKRKRLLVIEDTPSITIDTLMLQLQFVLINSGSMSLYFHHSYYSLNIIGNSLSPCRFLPTCRFIGQVEYTSLMYQHVQTLLKRLVSLCYNESTLHLRKKRQKKEKHPSQLIKLIRRRTYEKEKSRSYVRRGVSKILSA